MGQEADEFVRELERPPGKGVRVLGGGEPARVRPVRLGSGVPCSRDPGRRIELERGASRVIEGGCVVSTCRIRRP
ncbi:MAG TPA: hypothetical protein VNK43_05205 [Gemmatimonadales bacterium]|nr:hypothetical protein [Gemmatimonadales bacterium]